MVASGAEAVVLYHRRLPDGLVAGGLADEVPVACCYSNAGDHYCHFSFPRLHDRGSDAVVLLLMSLSWKKAFAGTSDG